MLQQKHGTKNLLTIHRINLRRIPMQEMRKNKNSPRIKKENGKMDVTTIINKAYDFIESYYQEKVIIMKNKGLKSLEVKFSDLLEYDICLSEELLDSPVETKFAFNLALSYFFKENINLQDVGRLSTVSQVSQVHRVSQVSQPFNFPDFIKDNYQRVIYLLSIVKSASQKEISEFLHINKKTLSNIFYRSDRDTGLVSHGYGRLTGRPMVGDYDSKEEFFCITSSGVDFLKNLEKNYYDKQKSSIGNEGEYFCRFYALPKTAYVSIGEVRVRHLNKFISIEAVIRRKSDVRPQITIAKFECSSCGNILNVLQLETNFKEPSTCSCGRKGKFRLISKRLKDTQHIVLEDLGLNTNLSEMKRLHVFISDDLCDKQNNMIVGNRVCITGIIKEIPKEINGMKTVNEEIFLEANHITDLDDKSVELTKEDEKTIIRFANEHKEKILNKLIDIFANNIQGNDHIKKALIIQLVSCDQEDIDMRLRVHIHLFGDYGIGKTQLALYSHMAAPKSVYAEATKASDVGITASVVKDEFLRTWALEAGAITLAGNGLCLIDEIDKLKTEDISSLGEPMEKGTITVHKANVHQTLPGNAKILTCGNFSEDYQGGLVDFKSLRLKQHIVDRYDLMLKAENVSSKRLINKFVEKLTKKKGSSKCDDSFLKKYLLYAANKVIDFNFINDETIVNRIEKFYSFVKDCSLRDHSIKFSPRLLETLFSLSIACAKIRLADKVELCDVNNSIDLVKRSIDDRNIFLSYEEELMN